MTIDYEKLREETSYSLVDESNTLLVLSLDGGELDKSIISPNSGSVFTRDVGKTISHFVGIIPVTSGVEVVYAVFGDKTVLVSGVDPSC